MTYCRKATGPNVGNGRPLQATRRGSFRLSRIGLRIGLVPHRSRIGPRIGRPASVPHRSCPASVRLRAGRGRLLQGLEIGEFDPEALRFRPAQLMQ